MTAKQYLDKYRELAAEIRAISEQIERLREFLTSASAGGGSGSFGGSQPHDRLGDGTGDVVDMERKKDAMMDEFVEMQVVIRRNLSKITNSKVREAIEYRFIKKYSHEKIAEIEHCDVRTVYRWCEKGLALLNKIWDA